MTKNKDICPSNCCFNFGEYCDVKGEKTGKKDCPYFESHEDAQAQD